MKAETKQTAREEYYANYLYKRFREWCEMDLNKPITQSTGECIGINVSNAPRFTQEQDNHDSR